MKAVFLPVILLLAAPAPGSAKDLSKEEVEAVKAEIDGMMSDFEEGDAKTLLDKTHDSIFELVGGREAFERGLLQGVKQIMESGIMFEESELGEPTELHRAGDEELCFVPRTSVIVAGGRKIRSVGFLVAIRPVDGEPWKFLDGAGLRRKPELLWKLLPDLPKDIELPPNTQALVSE
jgi:hypothetical protein